MMLLNGALLVFLGALGVPLLLHLLQLRRRKPAPLPTLRFLKEIERSRLRSLNVTRILLLLLRLLIVAAIVLAFARPVRELEAGATQGERVRILLLDDSASMREIDTAGLSAWDRARARGERLLRDGSAGSEWWLLSLSRPAAVAGPFDADAALRSLQSMEPGWGGARFDQALSHAVDLLSGRATGPCELHLVSDLRLQPGPLPREAESVQGLSAWLHSVDAGAERAGLLGIEIGQARGENLELGIQWQQGATLPEIEIELDDQLLHRQNARSSESGSHAASIPAGEPGWHQGRLSLRGEAPWRGELAWSLHLPEAGQAALLVGDKALKRVLLAATAREDGGSRLRVLAEAELPQRRPDLLVLGLGAPLESATRSWLRQARAAGMALLLMPESDIDLKRSTELLETLGLPSPRELLLPGDTRFKVDDWDLEHPVLQRIYEPGGRMESLNPGNLLVWPEDSFRVLARAGGHGLLLAGDRAPARVLLLASSPMVGEPGLAQQGIFAPLVNGALRWLGAQPEAGPVVECGRSASLHLPPGTEAATDWQLAGSGDSRWTLEKQEHLLVPALDKPGSYQLLADGALVALLSARVPREEVRLGPSRIGDWTDNGSGWLVSGEDSAGSGRRWLDASPWLLGLALILMLLESRLATGRSTHEPEF